MDDGNGRPARAVVRTDERFIGLRTRRVEDALEDDEIHEALALLHAGPRHSPVCKLNYQASYILRGQSGAGRGTSLNS